MRETFKILSRRGFEVEIGIPEEMILRPDRLVVTHDLYLLKSDTELALSLAGVLHAQGARVLNSYSCCLAVKDKIVATQRLHAAGIPTPSSWVTGDPALLRPLVEERALILKPYRGFHGAGIHLARNPRELAAVPASQELMLIQEYVPGAGEDLKVYVIGEDIFATRKPFSPNSFLRPGQPCPVTAEVRKIARRCGQVFGLGLYGMDIIESPDGPIVVDVNYFPGYKGVPDGPALLADYIEKYASERNELDAKISEKECSHPCEIQESSSTPHSWPSSPKALPRASASA
jgi:ribosomal protein S6--L-glutamate ligase